jgi:putative transposase
MKFPRDHVATSGARGCAPDIWHLDEVVVSIGGKKHWLWWAADQDGFVLDEIVATRRYTNVAKRLLKRVLKSRAARRGA